MSRPEYIADIEVENIEFATIEISKITLEPALLKGYTAFIEAVMKAGGFADEGTYRGVVLSRYPTLAEQEKQLAAAQHKWDDGEKQYNILASVGECERSWDRDRAEEWAKAEGMPFPPEVKPISEFHAVINSIDEVTA